MKIGSFPFVYAIFIVIFCFGYAANEFLMQSMILWKFSMIPSKIQKFQIWRLITYHIFPTNLVHLIINSLILVQIGPHLENHIGHIGFLMHTIIVSIFVVFTYTVLALITTLFDVYKTYNYPIMGPFGLITAFAYINAYITEQKYRSVFGIFHVPAKLYPYVMILIHHIALPNASILSSVSGLIVGNIYSWTQFKPPPKKINRKKESASRYITSMCAERELSNEGSIHNPFALFTLSWLERESKHSLNEKV